MKQKTGLVGLVRFWGVVFIIGVSVCFVILDFWETYRSFNRHTEQLKSKYSLEQKKMITNEVNQVDNLIKQSKATAKELLKEKTKQRVDEAWEIANNLHIKYKHTLTTAQLQNTIKEALRPIRFDTNGYYFIVKDDGTSVLSANYPSIEGKSLQHFKNKRINKSIAKIISFIKGKSETFYEYNWQKPGDNNWNHSKGSYFKRFEPYNWYIGTGLYLDDIEQEVQKRLLELIGSIRYGKNKSGYIFVVGYDGTTLMNDTQRKLIGSNILDLEDSYGVKFIKEQLKAIKKPEGGYVYYHWENPATGNAAPKVSYVKGIDDWQWMIGAGVYLNEIDIDIASMQKELNIMLKDRLAVMFVISIAVIGIWLLLLAKLSNGLKNDFALFSLFFKRAAHSDETINTSQVVFTELQQLAIEANLMLSDKRTAQQNLKDEQERLFVTIRSIADGVITTDTNGKVTLMNKVAEQLTGYSPSSAYGQELSTVFNIINANTGHPVNNPVQEVLAKGHKTDLANNTMLVSLDGNRYHIADSAAPITDYNNDITGVVLVFRDITQQYTMQKQLRQSEANLRSLFEAAKNAAFIKISNPNQQLTITEFSPGAQSLLGCPNSDLTNKPLKSIFPDTYYPTLQKHIASFSNNKQAINFEATLASCNGQEVYTLTSLHPVYDEDGKLESVILVAIDITDRKKAEESLKSEQMRLEAIISAADAGTWEWNVQTGETIFDDRWANMLGYTLDEIQPTSVDTWAKFIHPDDLNVAKHKLHEHFSGHTPDYECEARLKHKDGHWVWILDKGKVVSYTSDNQPLLMFGTHIDITKRKQAEQDMQQVEKLNSVGTLAGGIAHDFNNILMGLYSSITIAREALSPLHPSQKPLQDAESSMMRATRLTKQLLTFAKGGNPVKETTSLEELLEQITNFDLAGSNIKAVIKSQPGLWLANVDKGQIQQMFSNLVINAKHAMPSGGYLYIVTENEQVDTQHPTGLKPGKYLRITITDQGTGINPEHLSRIFDPYFTTKTAGTGLGLATVYSIVNRHSGHIGVDSMPGKGTTFTVYLPALNQPKAAPPVAQPLPKEWNGNILIMDDEELVCRTLKKILERSGFKIQTAADGEQAITLYQQQLAANAPFDVLIMDLTIPGGMGGKEAIKKLLQIDPNVKAIVSSGYADDQLMANYKKYGFKGLVAKPYTKNTLLKELNKVLKQE